MAIIKGALVQCPLRLPGTSSRSSGCCCCCPSPTRCTKLIHSKEYRSIPPTPPRTFHYDRLRETWFKFFAVGIVFRDNMTNGILTDLICFLKSGSILIPMSFSVT